MLIELRTPDGIRSTFPADPAESFWVVVSRLVAQYPGATIRMVSR